MFGQRIATDIRKSYVKTKLKLYRRIYYINRGRAVSFGKRLALVAAIKVAGLFAPGIYAQAQTLTPQAQKFEKKMLAMTTSINAEELYDMASSFADERVEHFTRDISSALTENINLVRSGAKSGQKNSTLRRLFGKINTRYYCAISALKTIEYLSENKKYFEYDFLLKCIENPHSCLSVIKGLTKAYGDECKTNNIREEIRKQTSNNPNAVFIAVVNSSANTSSGKHLVIITPQFIADTIVYADKQPQYTVYSLNSEVIQNMDKYLTGERNRGHVFNITEIGRDNLMEMFFKRTKTTPLEPTPTQQQSYLDDHFKKGQLLSMNFSQHAYMR